MKKIFLNDQGELSKVTSTLLKVALLAVVVLVLVVAFSNRTKDDFEPITSVEELNQEGMKVGGVVAAIVQQIFNEQFPNATHVEFNEYMDMVAALRTGQVDALMLSYPTAFLAQRSIPEFKIIDEPLTQTQAAVGVKKGNSSLLRRVNRALDELKKEGILEEMVDRWYDLDNRVDKMPDLKLPTEGRVLKVGVPENLEPAAFLNAKQERVGFDIELVYRLAIHMGRRVEFVPLTMAVYAPSLDTGIVDMVVGNFIINPVLKDRVDFSQPYFETPFVMVVRSGK